MPETISYADIIKIVNKFNSFIDDSTMHLFVGDYLTSRGLYTLGLGDGNNERGIIGSIKSDSDIFNISLIHSYNGKVRLRDVLQSEHDCFASFISVLNDNISLIHNTDISDIDMMDTFNETNVLSSFQDFKLIYDTNICFNQDETLPYICHTLSLYSITKRRKIFSVDIGEVVRHSNIDFSINIINNFFKNYYFKSYVDKCACEMTNDEKVLIKMLYI